MFLPFLRILSFPKGKVLIRNYHVHHLTKLCISSIFNLLL